MHITKKLGFFILVILSVAASALADDGVLVVHVIDIHEHPVPAVSIRAGAGSSVARVDSFGEARIKLAANTHPGDIVFLEMVASNRDYVFISPFSRFTAVPSFDNKPNNFVEITVVKRGDRALLENGAAARAMAGEIVQGSPGGTKPVSSDEALKLVAQKYGRTPEEIDLAIRNWGKDATDPFEKGLVDLYANKYPEAEVSLRNSFDEHKKKLKDEKVKFSESATLLGRVLRFEGKLTEALAVYKDAVENSPDDGNSMFGLAFVYLDLSEPAQAEEFANKALALNLQRFQKGDSELAETYYKFGAVYVNQSKYAKGEAPFRKALAAAEQSFGPDSPLIISYIDNLAIVCSKTGKMEEAETLIKRAQSIEKASLSPDDPEVVTTNSKLAGFYMEEGKYLDAEALLRQDMQIVNKYLAANGAKPLPPDFGYEALEALDTTEIVRKLRGYANQEDLAYLQETLMFQRALTGEQSVQAASRHEQVADLLRQQGRYKDAEAEYKQALEIRKVQFTSASLNLEAKLSYDLAAQGKQTEAEGIGMSSIESAKAAHSPAGVVLTAFNRLAELYSFEQKYAAAESTLKKALAETLVSPATIEPERIEATYRLVALYIDQNRIPEAWDQLMPMRSVLEKDAPSDAHITFVMNMAVLHIKQHQCDKAAGVLKEALAEASKLSTNGPALQNAVREKQITMDADCHHYVEGIRQTSAYIRDAQTIAGPTKHYSITMMGHLADIYSMDGQYDAAEKQYIQAISTAKTAQDGTFEDVAGLLSREAEMYIHWKRYSQAAQASNDALTILDGVLWNTDPALKGILEQRLNTCKLNHEGDPCTAIEARLDSFTTPSPAR
jgi:tetratricopeptide (TPR) repeat protein